MFVLFVMQSYLIEVRGLKHNNISRYAFGFSRIL